MSDKKQERTPFEEQLVQALHSVEDPEFPMSVVDMGLVYGLRADEGRVNVDLTFTAMGCPGMEYVLGDVKDCLLKQAGVDDVHINIVWSPPWSAARLTDKGRMILEDWGISI